MIVKLECLQFQNLISSMKGKYLDLLPGAKALIKLLLVIDERLFRADNNWMGQVSRVQQRMSVPASLVFVPAHAFQNK